MKKLSALAILIFTLLIANSQGLHVFEKGKDKPLLLLRSELDSITIEQNGMKPQQLFYTKDSLYTYNIADIDSIAFNLPYIKIERLEYYLPKIDAEVRIITHRSYFNNFNINCESDWISATSLGYGTEYWKLNTCYVDENTTGNERSTYVYVKSKEGIIDSIKVTQSTKHAFVDNYYNNIADGTNSRKSHTWQKTITPIKLNEPFLFTGMEVRYNDEQTNWINYTLSEDKKTLYIEVDENKSDINRNARIYPLLDPEITIKSNNYFVKIEQHKTGLPTPKEQRDALIDLYNTMDGANWYNNDNWLSDKTLKKWDGLNVGLSDDVMSISISGASGEFPASLATIMDVADAGGIHIYGREIDYRIGITHSITGKIPEELTQHPRWNEFGWELVMGNTTHGGGLNMNNVNLRIDSVNVEEFVNDTILNTYDILKKNKITLVFNVGAVDMIYGMTDKRVNIFLDYKDKGLGYVAQVGGYWDVTYDAYRDYVLKQQIQNNLPKEILWVKSFDKVPGGGYGSLSILDSEGNLLWNYGYVFDNFLGGFDEDGELEQHCVNQIDSVCRKYLGEPLPHDKYVSTVYKSTDYSKDGEVITLQKATVGNGIDLVFMGDMYVDTLLVDSGQFEKDMKASMEYFFEVEPYKSFRDRFNVYAVKAVSPTGWDGDKHVLNNNDNIVFEYVEKIPNVDIDNVTIAIVNYNPNFSFFESGYTNMYESGASIAYIEDGGPSSIIVHEAGGHGFAKLLDEYIYSGYEENYCPPENLESFKQWIKTDYHDRGWGMNIDTTNDPDSVVWSHFLKDTRYTGEVGIYQGAWYWPTDLWRASENSVMNDDYSTFNAPSREVIYKRIMQLSEGDDWVYDYEKFVEWDKEHQSSSSGGNSGSDTPDNPSGEIPDTPNDPNLIVIDGISYEIIGNGNVRIVGNDGSLSGVVEVKSTIVGADGTTYNVTEIGTRAFADCPDLMVLDIHENIELFEEGYLEGNQQDLTIIMRSTNPPQFADPYYGFKKNNWTLKIPMSAYDLYEDKGWTGELQVVEIDADQSTTKMKTALVRPMVDIKPTVRQIKNHRIPKIIKGSPLNPQGEVAIPDFFNKTK